MLNAQMCPKLKCIWWKNLPILAVSRRAHENRYLMNGHKGAFACLPIIHRYKLSDDANDNVKWKMLKIICFSFHMFAPQNEQQNTRLDNIIPFHNKYE